MTDYKPGDRVRVSFEGAVEHVFANGSLDVISSYSGLRVYTFV